MSQRGRNLKITNYDNGKITQDMKKNDVQILFDTSYKIGNQEMATLPQQFCSLDQSTGKILLSQLPNITIFNTFTVPTAIDRITLTTAEVGDVCIALDDESLWILTGVYSNPLDWIQIIRSNLIKTVTAPNTLINTSTGLNLTSEIVANNCYLPPIKFMSDSSNFTSENPKLMAYITCKSCEDWDADNKSASNLEFFTSPAGQTSNAPLLSMVIDSNGFLGISCYPTQMLDLPGTGQMKELIIKSLKPKTDVTNTTNISFLDSLNQRLYFFGCSSSLDNRLMVKSITGIDLYVDENPMININTDNIALLKKTTIAGLNISGNLKIVNTDITLPNILYKNSIQLVDKIGAISCELGQLSATNNDLFLTDGTNIIIEANSTNITLDNNVSVSGNLTTNYMSYLDGGITINTNKFTIDSVGNTYIDGTLEVGGATTLDSTLSVLDETTLYDDVIISNTYPKLYIKNSSVAYNNATYQGGLIMVDSNNSVSASIGDFSTLSNTLSISSVNPISINPNNTLTANFGSNQVDFYTSNTSRVSIQDTTTNILTQLSVGTGTNKCTFQPLSGTTVIGGLANLNGGIAVDTNKFTVQNATGNTYIDGSLTINNGPCIVTGRNIEGIIKQPAGLDPDTVITLSFNDATKTLTVTPTGIAIYYCNGVRYTFSTPQTTIIDSVIGKYYIYWDENGVIQSTTTYDDRFILGPWAAISEIYWNLVTAPIVAYEAHSAFTDHALHMYLHQIGGSQVSDGGDISGYTFDVDSNVAVTFGLSNFSIHDEDLKLNIQHGDPLINLYQDLVDPANIPIIYRNGSNSPNDKWYEYTATDYVVLKGASRAKYNLLTGSTWSVEEFGSNCYFNVFILASTSIRYPVKAILPVNNYATLTAATSAIYDDLNDINILTITDQGVILYCLTYQTKSTYTNATASVLSGIVDLRKSGTAISLTSNQNFTGTFTDLTITNSLSLPYASSTITEPTNSHTIRINSDTGLLYSSDIIKGNSAEISGLSVLNGIVQTDATGILSTSTDLPTATTIGTNYIYRAGGTDIPIADGGTNSGVALVNDRLMKSISGQIRESALTISGTSLGGIGTLNANSTLTIGGLSNLNGGIAVDTNKFTVQDATGNTYIDGILDVKGATGIDGNFDIATNKFTVLSASGNTTIAGTLGITGAITSSNLALTSGIIQTDVNGLLSSSTDLPTATTIGSGYIYRAGGSVIPISQGGTNSDTALVGGGKIMVSSGGKIIESTPIISGAGIGATTSLTSSSSTLTLATSSGNAEVIQRGDYTFYGGNSCITRIVPTTLSDTIGQRLGQLSFEGYNSSGTRLDLAMIKAFHYDLSSDAMGYLEIQTAGTTNLVTAIAITPTQNVSIPVTLSLAGGATINEFSIDDTMADDSDSAVPTEQAVKAYVDNKFIQCKFLARHGGYSNKTGDGTNFIVPFQTQVYDVGGVYNPSTFTFTAPATGYYHFDISINTAGWTAVNITSDVYFNVNGSAVRTLDHMVVVSADEREYMIHCGWDWNLTLNDACTVSWAVTSAAGLAMDFAADGYWSGHILL